MAKKKVAKKKGAKKKAAKKKAAALGHSGGVNLADVLRREGVNEQRIPEVLAAIRTLSDAQVAENSTPPAPTPVPVDSPAELIVAASADAINEERDRWRARMRQAIQSGRASDNEGRRNTLWLLEPRVLRTAPRASFVGRALYRDSTETVRTSSCVVVCETINGQNPNVLSDSLREAYRITRHGPTSTDPRQRRREATSAYSTIRKRITERIELMATERLRYVESLQGDDSEEYRLTRLGRKVFENWPNWRDLDANPWAGTEPPTGSADTSTDIT